MTKNKVYKYEKLKAGDKLFIHSSSYISSGSDDIAGGEATIKYFLLNSQLPKDHNNYVFVVFEEIEEAHSYNLKHLLEEQTELAEEYTGKKAHPDPDIDTPWIEAGDSVSFGGKPTIYGGDPIL